MYDPKTIHNSLIEIIEKSSTITERLSDKFITDASEENSQIICSKTYQWCEVATQGNWANFKVHLANYGLDEKTAYRAFCSVHLDNSNYLPEWAIILDEYLKIINLLKLNTLGTEDTKSNSFLYDQEPIPFQEVLLPLIGIAKQKLISRLECRYDLLNNQAHVSLERNLLKRLSELCLPSMQLEFSVFRACQQSSVVTRVLNESTKHSCYQNFIHKLLKGHLLVLLQEKPVLARLMAIATHLWIESTIELITRLDSDWHEINRKFHPNFDIKQVVAIQCGLSDYHYNGRSVIALHFASGLKLIYKPKSISLEEKYFKLLAWFNEQRFYRNFKLLKILNRSTYGWVELIENLPCKNPEEAKRYYERSGSLLCLTYVLNITDLHKENIIACGEHPVLIDLETLMHPWPKKLDNIENEKNSEYIAKRQMGYSVIRTGLLPRWQLGLENQKFDISGWGSFGEQKTSISTAVVNNINTDAMEIIYENEINTESHNNPLLNYISLNISEFVEDIINGFSEMYVFLIKNKLRILREEGLLKWFKSERTRYIFRSTKIYQLILKTLLDPKHLENGATWSMQLDIIARVMFLPGNSPTLHPLVKEERKALEKLDIPLFFTNSGTKTLFFSDNKVFDNFFSQSGENLVIEYLNSLNNDDLEKQVDLIKGSLYSRITENAHATIQYFGNHNISFKSSTNILSHNICLSKNFSIAEDIEKRAIYSIDKSNVTWISPQYSFDIESFQIAPLSLGMYDGISGLTVFLSAFKKNIGETKFDYLVRINIENLHRKIKQLTSTKISETINSDVWLRYISTLYSIVTVNNLLDISLFLDDAYKIVVDIPPNIILADRKFDILSGSSHTILVLLALYSQSVDQEVLHKAILSGNHLLNNRVVSESGHRTWATLDGKLLTGFSHGAAGIAYALLRLYKATGETRFKEAAEEAIAYERSVFIPELNNWPDFRQPQTKDNPKCMCSWCHGAPGIGLARVATLDILDTPEIRQDIEAAITTTLNYGLSDIDHLCCGNMGRVEFLFTAGRKLNRPELVDAAMKLASQVVARAEYKGHYGYGPILDFHPGFFQGAAGIGYQLLRLAYPDQLPSVLLWE
ncbi:type 2 lanthipeptide synthetase LanM family protein [Okeania sp.]|uniref:type 2 lanthipeptide synthetase LanM family protein n=1 Tax=Okeania sp. TaxID=3100323 RepID=UPI002B4B3CE2|nr:type 2 lanthipeptide synthetase LanM family protein [Okeania sp.]MEB3342866.1 type 2 lanthipeptide synthetase LanM family protein [Okeania sp.]